MKTLPLLLLAGVLPAAAFGQFTAIGNNTGVETDFYASIAGQDLFVLVDNTVAVGVTGTVTAFGFNTPWSRPLDLSKITISYQTMLGTGPTSPWTLLNSPDSELNAGGFQLTTDLAAQSDDNNNPNGNDPNNGVAFGEIVKFKFTFSDPYSLAAFAPNTEDGPGVASFFNQDPNGPDFFVRWQQVAGSTAGTSDAIVFDWPPDGFDDPQGGGVPEPSTYGVIGALLLLLLAEFRRFRR